MLLNRKEEVQATIKRLAEGPEIAAIRIYDKRNDRDVRPGRRDRATDLARFGNLPKLSREGQRRCEAVLERKASRIDTGSEVAAPFVGHRQRAELRHGRLPRPSADQKVLGVLDVEMSMAPLRGGHPHGASDSFSGRR